MGETALSLALLGALAALLLAAGIEDARRRTIGEIALSWGFSDLTHFSRAFAQAYRVAPREFRDGASR